MSVTCIPLFLENLLMASVLYFLRETTASVLRSFKLQQEHRQDHHIFLKASWVQRGWSFWHDPSGTQIVVLKAFCYVWFDVLDKSHLMVCLCLERTVFRGVPQ